MKRRGKNRRKGRREEQNMSKRFRQRGSGGKRGKKKRE